MNYAINNSSSTAYRVFQANKKTFKGDVTPPENNNFFQDKTVKKSSWSSGFFEKINDLNTNIKIFLGSAVTVAAIYGLSVLYNVKNKPSLDKITRSFSEIFKREVPEDEAKKLADRYKEILKISDTEEFTKTLFAQIKKDYGYEKAEIPLVIEENCLISGFEPQDCTKGIKVEINHNKNKFDKKTMMETLFREFRRVQQTELCYRTNAQKYIQSFFPKYNKQPIESNIPNLDCMYDYDQEQGTVMLKSLEKCFKNVKGIKNVQEYSNEANSFIEEIQKSESEKLKNDANLASQKANELYDYIASVWRMPYILNKN